LRKSKGGGGLRPYESDGAGLPVQAFEGGLRDKAARKIRWEVFTIPPPTLEELSFSGLIGAEPGEAFVCA